MGSAIGIAPDHSVTSDERIFHLAATLLSGQAVLPQAKNTDIYLGGLGILLTTVYIFGLIFWPKRQILHMGIDSLIVLVLYVIGIAGLFAITLMP